MLKYLVILLDDMAVPYCHYNVGMPECRRISLHDLSAAITFGMKENLCIQLVYPCNALPLAYNKLIDSVDHIDIKPAANAGRQDIGVCVLKEASDKDFICNNIVVRVSIAEFVENIKAVAELLYRYERVNLVLDDIAAATEADAQAYRDALDYLAGVISKRYEFDKKLPGLNILTDRISLNAMNNCNAGYESITVGPDGKFYVCPAFYYNSVIDCGSPAEGLKIKNAQLYGIEHAPICNYCDAWHCRRCVWLNQLKTFEVNTPGHMQCVMAHIERNASRRLLQALRQFEDFNIETEIPELSYLDPFEKIKR